MIFVGKKLSPTLGVFSINQKQRLFCGKKKGGKRESRPVFTFHEPVIFRTWWEIEKSLRSNLMDTPSLKTEGLRDCQIGTITKLGSSFKEYKPKALIQRTTGSAKTFTAISFIYCLLYRTNTKCILFLVDTKNRGEQAEQEILYFLPKNGNAIENGDK